MKVKSGYVLHSIGSENIVVAVDDRTEEFHGMIRLNSTGAFLWKNMQSDTTEKMLIDSLVNEYSITNEQATEAVASFISQLKDVNVIEI